PCHIEPIMKHQNLGFFSFKMQRSDHLAGQRGSQAWGLTAIPVQAEEFGNNLPVDWELEGGEVVRLLELLGIALEKKRLDTLETRMQGKCTGAMLRIIWRLMSSRSPRLGRSSQQMPGQGSLTHSPGGNCQGQKQDPSHAEHPCALLTMSLGGYHINDIWLQRWTKSHKVSSFP
ncbi:hypothetical protein J1605_021291, partial [Eschrichtius robustus]